MYNLKGNIRILILAVMLAALSFSGEANAQDKQFRASAPSVVQIGKPFNYSLTGEVQGRIKLPEMKGIRVVAGPGQSIRSGSSNINGRLQTVMEVTYTYMLMIDKEGEYEIPPALIIAGNKEYQSNPLSITAIKGTGQVKAKEPTGESGQKIMLRQLPSDRNIYMGEQIVLETKVYVRERLKVTDLEEPSYDGFWREELEADNVVKNEAVNGYNFRTQVIKRDLLTAQKTGDITIEPARMDVLIQKRVSSGNSRNIFDDFFNDPFFNDPFERYKEVPASFNSNSLTIHVKPLPSGAPASFKGAVGNFSLSAGISKDGVLTNESLVLRISIKGNGNLSLIQTPVVNFPPDLEVFEPRTNSTISHNVSGSSGSITYEYTIIPRSRGNFRIAPVEFSYFDPRTATYKNLKTDEFSFSVTGEGEEGETVVEQMPKGFFRDEVRNIENDIRYIKTGDGDLKRKSRPLVNSAWMIVYPIGLLFFFILLLIRRQSRQRRADINYVRNRKASKVAGRRLRNARTLMNADKDEFYEEVLKAFWGYLADKLGINTSDLSRDTVSRKLRQQNLPAEQEKELWALLDECEYARYAPGVSSDKKSLYNRAEKCLSDIEQKL